MRPIPALIVAALLLGGCQIPPVPPKPATPIAVQAAPTARGLSWRRVSASSRRSVVALTAYHPTFDSLGGYGRRIWESLKSFLRTPLRAPFRLLWSLFTGYLDGGISEGTGFVISPAGHVLTNSHVVRRGQQILATFDDGSQRIYRAELLARSGEHDLALLKLKAERPWEIFTPLGFRADVWLAEELALVGFPRRPWSQGRRRITVTTGVVSALGIDVGEASERFQTDAPANPGGSGSPSLGRDGLVLGIVAEHAIPSALEDQSFVIPSRELEKSGYVRLVRTAPVRRRDD